MVDTVGVKGGAQPVRAAVFKEVAEKAQVLRLGVPDPAGVVADGRVAGEDAEGGQNGPHLDEVLLVLRHLLGHVADLHIAEPGLHRGPDEGGHGLQAHEGLPHLHVLHQTPQQHKVLLQVRGRGLGVVFQHVAAGKYAALGQHQILPIPLGLLQGHVPRLVGGVVHPLGKGGHVQPQRGAGVEGGQHVGVHQIHRRHAAGGALHQQPPLQGVKIRGGHVLNQGALPHAVGDGVGVHAQQLRLVGAVIHGGADHHQGVAHAVLEIVAAVAPDLGPVHRRQRGQTQGVLRLGHQVGETEIFKSRRHRSPHTW